MPKLWVVPPGVARPYPRYRDVDGNRLRAVEVRDKVGRVHLKPPPGDGMARECPWCLETSLPWAAPLDAVCSACAARWSSHVER